MDGILHIIQAGGAVMYPLIILSVLAGTIMIERYVVFFQFAKIDKRTLKKICALCERDDFEEATKNSLGIPGPYGASLHTILESRDLKSEIIERRVQEVCEEFFNQLEKRLSFLDTVTTVSPLLGLLGTIVGMIGAFKAISAQGPNGNNDQVLFGVAEALYSTATGITVALICFIGYNYFSARLKHLTAETELAATKLINQLQTRELSHEV